MKTAYLLLLVFFFSTTTLEAQKRSGKSGKKSATQSQSALNAPDEALYSALEWRSIGPYRGGRSCAVTGVSGQPNLFYFGSTGGGVWRTQDGGSNWQNISDGYFGGSVGSIQVSEWDPNVIYVGGGEKTVRGNVSYGYGVWKSTDAGATWQQKGLTNSRHISRLRIHPKNPELVYAAVMGDLYKSSEERGVYRSKDGGENWERILFANADAGAVDLLLDPANPRIIYASIWNVRRTPYSFSSGGEGSSLWKSLDGGDSWKEISLNEGFPKGTLGIIGVAVSPVKPQRVWAMVEAEEGGLYRSDDGGKNWKRINKDRNLRQRAWYYTRLYADPQNEEQLYVLNVAYHRSGDGGKTFNTDYAPHGDHHDLWIDPEEPKRMIMGDDGGAQITFDGGINWSTYHNQPTSQFYRVTTDNSFPYRIYAAQQDNSTVRITHRSNGWSIGEQDWEPTAGGESAHIAIDPDDNEIVYGGSYGGFLTRKDHRTGQERAINVWPDNPMGHGVDNMRYRFQWNFPVLFSPHNSDKLYAASNHLHVSYNEGQSWETISPDLTTNDTTKQGPSGGPITKDNTAVEYYCTIFAVAESPLKEGVIWTGSDDGLVHLTQDGGKNWSKVTPANLPAWSMINDIVVDPFNEGGAYIVATGYKLGDYRPFIYKTENYGASWRKITNGIAADHFTRAIQPDPNSKGLLYAGTESGVYVSFDDGANWRSLQLNLPIVPITDLAWQDNNLIAATQGRSLWLIDDLTLLHQLKKQPARMGKPQLYKPKSSYRMEGGAAVNPRNAGKNHPAGVMQYFYLPEKADDSVEVSLSFWDGDQLIRKFSTAAKKDEPAIGKLKLTDSCNLFAWDMRYPAAKKFEGMVLWWVNMNGPKIVPGTYTSKLQIGEDGEVLEQSFEVLKDERSTASTAEMREQFDFLMEIREKMTETHEAIEQIRSLKEQLNGFKTRVEKSERFEAHSDTLVNEASRIVDALSAIEKELYQTKNRSRQDPLNYPIRLNNKLGHLSSLSLGDFPPTAQAILVKEEITALIDEQLEALKQILTQDVPIYNGLVRSLEVDAIIPD